VVSDGTTVWQYDPDLAQVVIRPLDKRADQVPSMLLAGEVEAVDKLYNIVASLDDAGAERFELQPRSEGSPLPRLALQFRAGALERLEITDGLAQRTEVSSLCRETPDGTGGLALRVPHAGGCGRNP
jgi:outer membrane lipoprotein carrier protein